MPGSQYAADRQARAGATGTRRSASGQEMECGLAQWQETGTLVNDELETADHSCRDEPIEVHRAAENDETA